MTDIIRQNERLLYLKELNKCIILFIYFHTKENLYLSDSKMRINVLIWGRAYARGAYKWPGNTSVKERWAYPWRGLYAVGGGGLQAEKYGIS